MNWNGQERRRFPRANFPCKIVISSPPQVGAPPQELVSHTDNIGEGGIRVILEKRLSYSDTVGLDLYLSKDKPIKCKGRVIWSREKMNPLEGQPIMFDTGIEFTTISDSDREYIAKMVDAILSS